MEINLPKAESKSVDLIQENIEQLKQIFSEVIKEGRVDFDALNDLLGN
jgi:adenine-specific DNA-methyltransferase